MCNPPGMASHLVRIWRTGLFMSDPKFPEESQSLEEDGLILQIWQYRILLKKFQ